jgi:hypothetical protein
VQSTEPPTDQPPPPEPTAACRDGYTATKCSGENAKFANRYDYLLLLGVPGLFGLLLPLVLARWNGKGWWRTNSAKRWGYSCICGFLVGSLILVIVPFMPQLRPVPPEVGLLQFLGVDGHFIEACEPCKTNVTNPGLLLGTIHAGMTPHGLLPQEPLTLMTAMLFALLAWSFPYWGWFLIYRWWKGLDSRG